jgi:hypothetical protein
MVITRGVMTTFNTKGPGVVVRKGNDARPLRHFGKGHFFFFAGAAGLAAFAGALALAFFLSLLCALLPFAMIKSFP